MTDRLDTTLMPDYSALRSKAEWNYTLQNYIETRGSLELAIAFANLFWPELVEYQGCIVRRDALDPETFEKWWQKSDGDRAAVERMMNFLHVREIAPNDDFAVDVTLIRFLGNRIAEMWQQRAQTQFPTRHFRAWYDETEGASDGSVYLCQV